MEQCIQVIRAREILAATGRPTIETVVQTSGGLRVSASVPCGTSIGKYEACDVRDGGSRFRGQGVLRAVANVNTILAPCLQGRSLLDLAAIDRAMIELDGTPNKSRLGANAILSVSLACAKAGALVSGQPLYRYLWKRPGVQLPGPAATVLAGRTRISQKLGFEDYLYVLKDFPTFANALEALVEIRLVIQEELEQRYGTLPEIGDALVPPISSTTQAFDIMLEVLHRLGCQSQVGLGLDAAAGHCFEAKTRLYAFEGTRISTPELHELYQRLAADYPLIYLEDPFQEDDFAEFALLRQKLPECQIVGDDLFATNPKRILNCLRKAAADAVLLKPNQIGTVTEALEAAQCAEKAMTLMASIRSHDTEDPFLADFAVAVRADLIKLGSPVRAERNAKYNRLLEIEQDEEPLLRKGPPCK